MTPVAAIVIGRNEGARLIACLESLKGLVDRVIYVDSGSTDGSQEAARAQNAQVVELDMSQSFTAARARNAGLDQLRMYENSPAFVQIMDGDCMMDSNWISTATAYLETHPEIAVVCGRRRERFPEASLWNRMIDDEWNTPIGEALACGGDAMMRMIALDEVGGYNPAVIAGEEPEMCVRLRAAGWKIWRLDAEMTLHDANMMHIGQWWQRAKRAGHAFTEGAAMHGAPPEAHYIHERKRALLWGVALPLVTLLGLFITMWAALLLLVWPLQMLRLKMKGFDRSNAVFLTLAKLPEGQGALRYLWNSWRGKRSRLIEYK